jgi:1-acyl-sn-glycerol-3-phosphate acyltransferase
MFRSAYVIITVLFLTVLLGLPCIFMGWIRRERAAFAITRFYCRMSAIMAGVKITFDGLENIQPDTGYIVVANHQSLLDIPITVGMLPLSIRMLAKKELFRIPIFGPAMRAAGHVSIDRDNPRKAIASLAEASRRMREQNICIMMYPEGTRSVDGVVQPFKRGAFRTAHQLDAPILPIAIAGTCRVLPKKATRIVPGPVRVTIFPPIPLAGIERKNLASLSDQVQQQISERVAKDLTEIDVQSKK